MYSRLIERMCKIPRRQYEQYHDTDLNPREVISRAMRDDITLSYAVRIHDTYFPNETLDEIFKEDEEAECHLTAADVVHVMERNRYYGAVIPEMVFNVIFRKIKTEIGDVSFRTGDMCMQAWLYAAGVAEGKKAAHYVRKRMRGKKSAATA